MSINQQVTFKSNAEKIYKVLTTSLEFSKVTGAPADIAKKRGGSVFLFRRADYRTPYRTCSKQTHCAGLAGGSVAGKSLLDCTEYRDVLSRHREHKDSC